MPTKTSAKPTPKKKPAATTGSTLPPARIIEQYAFHGCPISPDAPVKSGQVVGDCLFCDKEKHFYLCVDEKASGGKSFNGGWDCKRCGLSGNLYTYLQLLYQHCLAGTTDGMYTKLRDFRNERIGLNKIGNGIPAAAYKDMAWNPYTSAWILPISNTKGALCNLLTYDPTVKNPYFCPTPDLPLRLYNGRLLNETVLSHMDGVILCEGPWDAMALEWLLSSVPESKDKHKYAVIAVCGATAWPESELAALRGQNVILCYDNDDAGAQGLARAAERLKDIGPASVRHVVWESSRAKGFDLTDFISSRNERAHIVWRELQDMLVETPVATGAAPAIAEGPLPEVHRTSFKAVLADFTKTGVKMSSRMRDGLAVSLATALSTRTTGDPLWTLLVGPSGCGKSLLLETFAEAPEFTHLATTFSPKSFISGFNLDSEDPSLLAAVTNPSRCLLTKDYTAVITLPSQDLEMLYGLLRDAYDGRVIRAFGNGVVRDYTGYFSILAGVTPKIHTLSHTDLGERFIKFELAARTNLKTDDYIMAAILAGSNGEKDREARRFRQAAISSLLAHKADCYESLPAIDMKLAITITNLAKFTAICRAKVERDKDGVLKYEASTEVASRLGKQYGKLAQFLAVILDSRGSSDAKASDTYKIDDSVMKIIAKVAWDTAFGRYRDAIEIVTDYDSITVSELSEQMEIPDKPTRTILADLYALSVLSRKKIEGKNKYTYTLTPTVLGILEKSKISSRSR